jgi:hypothetical protein
MALRHFHYSTFRHFANPHRHFSEPPIPLNANFALSMKREFILFNTSLKWLSAILLFYKNGPRSRSLAKTSLLHPRKSDNPAGDKSSRL